MKNLIPLTAIAALVASGISSAQDPTPAYSKPSGYVDLGAVAAKSEITFSVPLLNAPEASATVISAAGSVVTLDGTPLDSDVFNAPVSGAPYMVEITTGTSAGLFLVVSSNTDSTITVMLGNGETLEDLVSGDQLSLRKAWTLETLLPSADLPEGAQVAGFDVQSGVDNSATPLYLNNPSFGGWIDGATFGAAGNAVLYPGESFILINNTDTPITSLVVVGQVPTSPSRLRIANDTAGVPQDTRIAYVGPVDETLNEAGFAPSEGDQLLVYNQTSTGLDKSASQILIFNSSFGGWIDGATFSPVGDTFKLKGGQGYVYRRSAQAPAGDQVISDIQTYIPNLNN